MNKLLIFFYGQKALFTKFVAAAAPNENNEMIDSDNNLKTFVQKMCYRYHLETPCNENIAFIRIKRSCKSLVEKGLNYSFARTKFCLKRYIK